MTDWLQQRLAQQRREGRYRQRQTFAGPQQVHSHHNGRHITSFCSNDYLGLANHPAVKAAFQQGINNWGAGAGAAHLISGHRGPHQQLEEALAEFTGYPRALLFSTGYMANLAIAGALLLRGDSIIEDRLNHASLIDAGRLSEASLLRYQHGDADSARRQLQRAEGHRLLMTDGVFSMDGDLAPLPELARTCADSDALLMVDDAHGFGVLGANGRGTLEHFGLNHADVPVLMATLGKGLGTFGAFVASSEAVIESLIQFGRSYIYTTASPPALAAATLAALNCVQEEAWRRDKLYELISHWREQASTRGLALMSSESPIQPLLIGDDQRCEQLGQSLFAADFHVGAIRPPTVPAGSARLRITLCAEHEISDIDRLVEQICRQLER